MMIPFNLFFKKLCLFVCLFMAALCLRCYARTFSSFGERGLLFIAVRRLLIAVASLVAEHRLQARGLQQLQHTGFNSCSTQAQQLWLTGSRVQAQQLWHMGLVAPRHVGSSWTRARTRVPCIGRRILNHCATREIPNLFLYLILFLTIHIEAFEFSGSVFSAVFKILVKEASRSENPSQCSVFCICNLSTAHLR